TGLGIELNPTSARNRLAENVKGLGMKESSHFLRNIGLGEGLAILDRHIVRNLLRYGAIKEMPKNLGKKNYLLIEEKMRQFSKRIGIPLAELDLLFWSKETGKIFK
ncbi:MAG: DNA lyase, partial [Candidatus Diapherotrites archaeon]|nr:DNA lyase [Candidatus Diapherotrites archaeon]